VIPLFRHHPVHAPDRICLEDVVCRHADIPIDVLCQESQVVEGGGTVFVPLEASLAALYRQNVVSRSIFGVLGDLEELLPLHYAVRRRLEGTGLLVPDAENVGFRLHTIIGPDHRSVYADIVWQPRPGGVPFHVRIAQFAAGTEEGIWKPHGAAGVCELLADELHRLVPGRPRCLFTQKAQELLFSRARAC
jgi:hypothetical protein